MLDLPRTPAMEGDGHVDGRYHALPDPITDDIFMLFSALATEVWSLRDRLHITEAALANLGVDLEEIFRTRDADEGALAEMHRDCEAFVNRIYRWITPVRPVRANDLT